jgi:hypothetical protein
MIENNVMEGNTWAGIEVGNATGNVIVGNFSCPRRRAECCQITPQSTCGRLPQVHDTDPTRFELSGGRNLQTSIGIRTFECL